MIMIRKLFTLHLNLFYPRVFLASDNYIRSLQAVLSNGFAFCLMWNVLENGYLEPHANTRIDFHRERGKVSRTYQRLKLKFCSNLVICTG